jgi:hypothetical protein
MGIYGQGKKTPSPVSTTPKRTTVASQSLHQFHPRSSLYGQLQQHLTQHSTKVGSKIFNRRCKLIAFILPNVIRNTRVNVSLQTEEIKLIAIIKTITIIAKIKTIIQFSDYNSVENPILQNISSSK